MKKYQLILLIDDNRIDNFIHQHVLSKADVSEDILIKNSAVEALEYLKNPDHVFPDVIFLDIRMPIMDGFGFLRAFEELPEEKKSAVKIFLLSSSIDPIDVEEARKYKRITRFIQKPLDISQLSPYI